MLNDFRLVLLALYIVLTMNYVQCTTDLPNYYKEQISRVRSDVQQIHNYLLRGAGRGQTFDRLAELGDKFESRLTGTPELEEVIDYILQNLTQENFANVHGENVTVPKWSRGREYAELIHPRHAYMPILALGRSVGTFNSSCNCTEPLVADAIVVRSFDDLDRLDNATVAGKIVVYNVPWQGSYGATVVYRSQGALKAQERGAVAALIRSVTQFSIASPHTGVQTANVTIPGACITIEDAEMLQRMYDRGTPLKISLYMEAKNEGDTISRNVVAELRGSHFPNEAIIIGGHIDAWDVGTGSMDDGGGCLIAWQALSAIKALNLKPRRTIRLVLWTAEEQGLIGGIEYYEAHKDELSNVSLIIESDNGAFKPRGVRFTGNTTAELIIKEVLGTLMTGTNATEFVQGGSSSDTGEWVSRGVPGMELYSYNEDYFFFHHSHGDAMTVLDRDDLDLGSALWATIAYTVAMLDEVLPRVNCPDLRQEICATVVTATTPDVSSTTPGISRSAVWSADVRWLLAAVAATLLHTALLFNRRLA